jgi:hypothetical protein
MDVDSPAHEDNQHTFPRKPPILLTQPPRFWSRSRVRQGLQLAF